MLKDELRLYPYEEDNIRRAVEKLNAPSDRTRAAEEAEREAENPITLRVFNQYLDLHLIARLDDLVVNEYKIQDQTEKQLAESRIDLTSEVSPF